MSFDSTGQWLAESFGPGFHVVATPDHLRRRWSLTITCRKCERRAYPDFPIGQDRGDSHRALASGVHTWSRVGVGCACHVPVVADADAGDEDDRGRRWRWDDVELRYRPLWEIPEDRR